MSPRANVRDPGEGGGEFVDRKGDFVVRYEEIAAETMKPKSPDSPFKESLRVVFGIEGENDQTVSLSVQIENPADDLWGFVPDHEAAPKDDELALRRFIEANVIKEPTTVYVSGFVQSRVALEGAHIFERIIRVYQYARKRDGARRMGMVAVTADGLTTSWVCPEPDMRDNKKGDTPDGDECGPFSADTYAFQYLQVFGLDWEKMKRELEEAEAYWPGHYDADGMPIEPLFPDLANPWPGFLAMIERHGPKRVKMEIVRDKNYDNKLGPRYIGKGLVKMIEVEGGEIAAGPSRAEKEFDREAGKFMENYDALTNAVLAPENGGLRFMVADHFTDQGKRIGMSVLKPLIYRYPDAVTAKKENGEPAIALPPTFQTWTLNGVVVANMTAERLLLLAKLDKEDLFKVVNLTDPAPLLAWVTENVPEWETVGQTDDGGELL